MLDELLSTAEPWRDDLFYALPSVPVASRHLLPPIKAIYFVFETPDRMLYIGKSQNLQARWRSHHRLRDLLNYQGSHIHWLRLDYRFPVVTMGALELWCIDRFRPRYNYTPTINPWRERFRALLVHTRRVEAENRALRARLSVRAWTKPARSALAAD